MNTRNSSLSQPSLTRRAFLRRALAVAAVTPAIPALLAGCNDISLGGGDAGPPDDFAFIPYQGVGDPETEDEVMFSEVFEDGRPVILNFWAGQCPPCRAEMPDFQEIAEEYGDEIFLFGLDVGVFTMLGTQDDARTLLEELEITYPAGYAVDQQPLIDYNVLSMPTTVFFAPDGDVIESRPGLIHADEMRRLIDEALAAT